MFGIWSFGVLVRGGTFSWSMFVLPEALIEGWSARDL
jgi:hypothetical protein